MTSSKRLGTALAIAALATVALGAAKVADNGFGTASRHDVQVALGVDAAYVDANADALVFTLADGACSRVLNAVPQVGGTKVHAFWFYGFADAETCRPEGGTLYVDGFPVH